MIITFVAYPESMCSSLEDNISKLLISYPDLKYWCILHNKDIDINGELKKEHYHIVLSLEFKNKSHTCYEKSDIAKLFGRNLESIEKVNNPTGIIRYLIHCDNNDKYQYDLEEVITNDIDILQSAIELQPKLKKSADDDLEELFTWIDNSCYISQIELFNYQRQRKLFFKFSAVSKIIQSYVEWHNMEIERKCIE